MGTSGLITNQLRLMRRFQVVRHVTVLQHRRWTHQDRAKPQNGMSYINVPGKYPLLGITIPQLFDQSASQYCDLEGLVVKHQGIRRTFGQLQAEATDFAKGLLAIGFEKGDRIGMWSPNNHEWYITKVAAAKAGLILVNINPAYEGPEVLYCMKKVGIRGIVIADEFRGRDYYDVLCTVLPSLSKAEPGQIKATEVPNLAFVISTKTEAPKGTYAFGEIMLKGSSRDKKQLDQIQASIRFDDIFNIQFTSGTTGKPKGVMLTHHNMVNNSFLVSKRCGYATEDKLCLTVPSFHCYGGVAGLMAALHAGATSIFPSASFDPKAALRVVKEEKCTALYGTPTMHVDMINSLEENELGGNLRMATTAGSICPEDLVREMTKRYGCKVTSFYGLTETSPVFYQSLPEDSDDVRITTVGYPQEHSEVRVVDGDGRLVPLGVPGELCVRGYTTMLGYWEDPVKTNEVLTESGWFHTGDIFVMEESGHARVVGRLKDLIIRGGENIYPREIEDFLHLHPKIIEAYVFGIPDKRLGEVVAAWIRLKDGEKMTEAEFRSELKGKIAAYKLPKYVFFRSDFPKTASGKIQKFAMRNETMKVLGIPEQK